MRQHYNALHNAIPRRFHWIALVWCLLAAGLANPAAARTDEPTVLALGDSLTAGYGLEAEGSFPAQLERALAETGVPARVINAGVSGDTTAGGLARLDWLIADGAPDVLLVELGANDGLRAIDPDETKANLAAIIERGLDAGSTVLLAGMYAPPNLGEEYVKNFNAVYLDLAAQYEVIHYPFFLDGVAGDVGLNQHDGLHPTAEGVAVIVERILPSVMEALRARR